jgi:DNA-binding response OmpR family regulator
LVSKRSVLIVDRSEETREVLATALERRGLQIFASGRAERGLELARAHRPDLIVLDLEVGDAGPAETCSPFAEEARATQAPLVVLGSVRRNERSALEGEFVPKPYHFGPLIRKIEELLSARGSYARIA